MNSFSLSQRAPSILPNLSGRTLLLARSVWLFICGSATLVFLAALPARWAVLTHPSPTNTANLAALGLTSTFFAAYSIFWELVIVVPNIIVGFILFWRCGEQRIALFTSLVLIVFNVANGTLTPTLRALLGAHPALDFYQHALEFIAWYGFALFFYLFPDGRFVPAWTRWLALILLPIYLLWNFAEDSPLAPLNWPQGWFMLLFLAQFGSWIFSQVYRFRRVSGPVERQQTKWVVFAIVTTLLVFILIGVVGAFVPGYNLLVEEQSTPQGFAFMLGSWLISPVMLLLPIAVLFSVIRYRLWDIDLVINRTLVYGLLTASTMGLYILVIGSFNSFFQTNNPSIAAFLATGLVAVVFQPLRLFLQRMVNRLIYGERDDPYAVLSRLRQRLDLAISPGEVLPAILETITQALKLPYAALSLRDETTIAHGTLPANAQTELFPLLYRGETIGQLVVAPRAAGESLTASENRLLADIAHQAGIAAYNLGLNAELQRAREHLVTAREEERRRLRRDLHDGLGPKLAGQALILEAIRDSLETDSQNRALVDHLIQDSQAVVTEIRELVHGLRPPALDDHGLVGALRLLAARCENGKIQIGVTSPDPMPAMPAAVEVAAYRITQEALTNVVKHAQARFCQVNLRIDQALELTITDDGVGFPESRPAGVGLASMRERAEEIGGQCFVRSEKNSGTRVTAILPIQYLP